MVMSRHLKELALTLEKQTNDVLQALDNSQAPPNFEQVKATANQLSSNLIKSRAMLVNNEESEVTDSHDDH